MRNLASLVSVCLLIAACDGDSPTSADSRAMQLTGTITATHAGTHVVTMNDTGNLRVTLDDVRPILLDVTSVDPSQLVFLFSLGSLTSANDCEYTYSTSFAKGSAESFGLSKGAYCVTLSKTDLPDESSVAYAMTATVTD